MTHQFISYVFYAICVSWTVLATFASRNAAMRKNRYFQGAAIGSFLLILILAVTTVPNITSWQPRMSDEEAMAEIKIMNAELAAMNKFMELRLTASPSGHDFFIDWFNKYSALRLLNNTNHDATMKRAQTLLEEMYKQYPSTQPSAAEQLRQAADELEQKESEEKLKALIVESKTRAK